MSSNLLNYNLKGDSNKMNKDLDFILRWAKKIKAIEHMGGKCQYCGTDDIMTLTFHHASSSKEGELGRWFREAKRWSKIKKEIEKCELLCFRCHNEFHVKNGRVSKGKKELVRLLGQIKCSRCGYENNDNFAGMEFHHLESYTKNKEIWEFYSKGRICDFEDLIIEMGKCEILCSNCHLREHTDIDRFEKHKVAIKEKITSYREKPIIDRLMVMRFHKDGMGVSEIAKKVGCAKSSVSYLLNK